MMGRSLRYAVALALYLCAGAVCGQPLNEREFNNRRVLIDSLINSDQYEEALPLLERQIADAKAAGAPDSLYVYVYNLGRAAWKVNGAEAGIARVEEVIDYLESQRAGPYHLLKAYEALTWTFHETGLSERCIEADLKYYEICRSWQEAPVELRSMASYNLGFDYMATGNWELSAKYFRESIEPLLSDSTANPVDIISSYNALGAALIRKGNFREAREALNQSLLRIKKVEDPVDQLMHRANVYGNLSLIADYEGDVVESKDLVHRALAARRSALNYDLEPWAVDQQYKLIGAGYHNLVALYLKIGDYARAREALRFERRFKTNLYQSGHPEISKMLEASGSLHLAMLEFDSARVDLKAYLADCLRRYGRSSYYTGSAHIRLAKLNLRTDSIDECLAHCDAAVEILTEISGGEASPELTESLLVRAKARAEAGLRGGALDDCDRAARLYSASRGEVDFDKGKALAVRAELLDHFGEVEAALSAADSALHNYKARLDELRSGKGANVSEAMYLPGLHYLRCRLLLKGGDREAALQELEEAVAALRNSKRYYDADESRLFLFEDHSRIFETGTALLFSSFERTGDERLLNRMFSLAEEGRTVLLRGRLADFSSLRPVEVPDSLLKKEQRLISMLTGRGDFADTEVNFFAAEEEYRALQAYLADAYPAYYQLRYDDRAAEISEVQSELLNPETSLIRYLVAGDSLYAVCISATDAHAVHLQVNDLDREIAALNKAIVSRDQAAFRTGSEALYNALFEPLKPFIKNSELLIVPDRSLFNLNFEVLTDPKTGRMVIEDFVISYLHSVTTALQFKNLSANGASVQTTGSGAVGFAPGFSDEVKRVYASAFSDSTEIDTDYFLRIRQPFAESTARVAAALFPGKAHIGTDATETRFKSEADRYGIIHLGTHTEINNLSPMLSRLVLTKSPDGADDGYLHAYEIYNLGLRAELAVLTACETGGGKETGSEGVLSLAHSFAYAGVPSIVMTLWQVDEKASAEVIESFYGHLADGMPKNKALRKAKLEFAASHQGELSAPFYWSGLVLIGDAQPVSRKATYIWWYGGGLLLLIVLSIIAYSRRYRRSRR